MRITGKNLKTIVNGLSVSYNDNGPADAPVVIFIHGFPFNKSMWDEQMNTLQDNYRVIAYDVRGHGQSDAGEQNFSIDLFTKDLLSIMQALSIEKATLCGLSMGGYIALNAVGKYPERCEALILSDTQCLADTYESKGKKMKAIAAINANGVEQYAEESIKNLFATESFSTKKTEIAAVRAMIVGTSSKSLSYTLFALSERKGTCSKLQDIKIPVLIIVGKEDKITPPTASLMIHEKIQGSLLKILDHAGHLANLENPSEFNLQMKNFLHQITKKPVQMVLARRLVMNVI
ncbi:MAG: alpha/beta fold hydrolase [Saprospiraceae bacterium]|nr:alpha/beta fold hydrolase [Saprospiraceae bacterium]